MKTLIISAANYERRPLEAALATRGLNFVSESCGIGSLAAAASAKNLSTLALNKSVIFVGTCGSFADFETPYLVTSHRFLWSPTSDRHGLSYSIESLYPEIINTKSPPWAAALPPKTTLCSPSISLNNKAPIGFIQDDLIENLEIYSCAREIIEVCHSFAIIFGVTNSLDANAHTNWQNNHHQVESLMGEFIADALGKWK